MNDSLGADRLQSVLAQLQQRVMEASAAGSDVPVSSLYGLYQQLLQGFEAEPFTPAQQPYVTEFHKQLRLLGNDILFLKSARQPATRAQRLAAIGDRLQTLQGYCNALKQ